MQHPPVVDDEHITRHQPVFPTRRSPYSLREELEGLALRGLE